jgi:RNA polymerase primary sigma factor
VTESQVAEKLLTAENLENSLRAYLNSTVQFPLLTRKEEIELGKKIETGREKGRRNRKAERELVEANLRLVIGPAIAYFRIFRPKHLSVLDLISEGNIGLLKAAEKFDWRKGCKFSTYAIWWIKQKIYRAIIDQDRQVRIPSHANLALREIFKAIDDFLQKKEKFPTIEEIVELSGIGIKQVKGLFGGERLTKNPVLFDAPLRDDENNGDTLRDSFIGDSGEDVLKEIFSKSTTRAIRDVLSTLTPREEKVIRRRFGIGCDEETLEEIGSSFKVSRERIRQIEAKAIERLRHPLRVKELKKLR